MIKRILRRKYSEETGSFMMPVLGALILQAAYGAVDLLVVGRFGSTSDFQLFLQEVRY